jgi:hypothetical protein
MLVLMSMTVQNGQEQPAKPVASDTPPVQFALRLGPQLGPRFGYTAGLDIELRNLSMGPGWSTRFDGEALWQPRGGALFDNVNTLFAINVCQVFSHPQGKGRRIYAGFGIGGYGVPVPGVDENGETDFNRFYTDRNRFGGKLFFGTQFTPTTGVEMDLHMVESSRPLLTLQARLKLW